MSKDDPLLRRKEFTEDGARYVLKAHGGLHLLSGNSGPYFSLTGELYRNGRLESCGCMHDDIIKHFPEFADMAALHLSDIDGSPSHAAENGLYWLAGSFEDGLGMRYHGSSLSYGRKTPDKTPADCLRIAADHFRVKPEELQPLRDRLRKLESNYLCGPRTAMESQLKAAVSEFVEAQRDRWKQEAADCIKRHGLKLYGDCLRSFDTAAGPALETWEAMRDRYKTWRESRTGKPKAAA